MVFWGWNLFGYMLRSRCLKAQNALINSEIKEPERLLTRTLGEAYIQQWTSKRLKIRNWPVSRWTANPGKRDSSRRAPSRSRRRSRRGRAGTRTAGCTRWRPATTGRSACRSAPPPTRRTGIPPLAPWTPRYRPDGKETNVVVRAVYCDNER